MKTNEEFLEGVYGKHDALVKKRKKLISLAATAACAVLCVGVAVSAGVLNSESADKSENKSEMEYGYMNSGESASGETNYISADYETTKASFGIDGETAEIPEGIADAEGTPEMFNQNSGEIQFVTEVSTYSAEAVSQKDNGVKIQKEEGENEIGTSVIEMPEEETQAGGAVQSTAAPSSKPMPSTEKIVEAAYNSLHEEEKQYVIKDSAEAMVTRNADGTQTYEVYFKTTLDQYWKIKLDSELNVIPQNAS